MAHRLATLKSSHRAPHLYLVQEVHQGRQQPTSDHLLDLTAGSSGYVAQGPGCLLLYGRFMVVQEMWQDRQDSSINGHLGLQIRSCDYVTDGPQGWALEKQRKGTLLPPPRNAGGGFCSNLLAKWKDI